MTDQGPGDSKGKTSGGMYNTASTSSRCLIAAGVIGLVVLSLIIIEMLFVPIWTDSRGDYYSGMIGVIIALAGVSITGYIFLTEHLASSALIPALTKSWYKFATSLICFSNFSLSTGFEVIS